MKQLAADKKVELDKVKEAINSQFEYVAEKIAESNLEEAKYNNIYIQNLGRFVVILNSRKKIKERLEKKKDGVSNAVTREVGDISVCPDNK